MAKYHFNQAETYWLSKGLDRIKKDAIAEIEAVEKAGNNPIMTKGYIIRELDELQKKINSLTKPDKYARRSST